MAATTRIMVRRAIPETNRAEVKEGKQAIRRNGAGRSGDLIDKSIALSTFLLGGKQKHGGCDETDFSLTGERALFGGMNQEGSGSGYRG